MSLPAPPDAALGGADGAARRPYPRCRRNCVESGSCAGESSHSVLQLVCSVPMLVELGALLAISEAESPHSRVLLSEFGPRATSSVALQTEAEGELVASEAESVESNMELVESETDLVIWRGPFVSWQDRCIGQCCIVCRKGNAGNGAPGCTRAGRGGAGAVHK